MLAYAEFEPRKPFRGGKGLTPISQWDSKRVMLAWRTHAENRALLDFYMRNGTFDEKCQARKELTICERKLTFWERHPSFSAKEMEYITAYIHRQWRNPLPRK